MDVGTAKEDRGPTTFTSYQVREASQSVTFENCLRYRSGSCVTDLQLSTQTQFQTVEHSMFKITFNRNRTS